jgi:3-hydroxyacyl-CoA dehydrogenase
MADPLLIYVPTLTPTLWATLRDLYGGENFNGRLIVEIESAELDDMFEEGEFDPIERFYTLVDEDDSNGHSTQPDIAWVDYSEPGDLLLDQEFVFGREALQNAQMQIVILGIQALSQHSWQNQDNPERIIGVRPIFREEGLTNLEIIDALSTSQGLMREFVDHLQDIDAPFTNIWLDVAGGASLRFRSAIETETWSLLRTAAANPAWINRLTAEVLGREDGLFDEILARDPEVSWLELGELAQATFGDGRFRPNHDTYPPSSSDFWSLLTASPDEPTVPESYIKRPESVLIIGTPHLAEAWKDRIYASSGGKTQTIAWEIWDSGSITEEGLKTVLEQGPFDLALEVLLGPPDERQQVIDLIVPTLAKGAQVWVHTLNLPSTITVQPVPEVFTAVGFGGLPPFGESLAVELSRPRNSSPSDLDKAMGAAYGLGLQPIQVADEPGGVSARIFAILINIAAWLLHERLFSSPADVDTAMKRAFGMSQGPFRLADELGLDVVEAVMLGLQANLGGERYRLCPSLTLRIEAGELGRITDKGFFIP